MRTAPERPRKNELHTAAWTIIKVTAKGHYVLKPGSFQPDLSSMKLGHWVSPAYSTPSRQRLPRTTTGLQTYMLA
eukprot:1150917-Pelagomonas_calceolata.AAC.4